MTFNSETAAIRFGTGLSPNIPRPQNLNAMLAQLSEPDHMAKRFKIDGFNWVEKAEQEIRRLKKLQRANPDQAKKYKTQVRKLKKQARIKQSDWLRATFARGIFTNDGFRERLVQFWADHFTVVGKQGVMKSAAATFVEESIRPHISAKFGDMLKAAIFHPMMLFYLDQIKSVGPASLVAVRSPGRGINENLAREVLELHTLGVEGAYTQSDIKELAKLFAGLTYRRKKGFTYDANMAEPGPETVLGKPYGGYIQDLFHITDFLDDLAIHPDTARHLAQKLVVHFISDTPDADLVDKIASAYMNSGGDLMACYKAMLSHPAAWAPTTDKIKWPSSYMISAIRVLGVNESEFTKLKPQKIRILIVAPMGLMGQLWENPRGPDGWKEDAKHWISPQGLAARIQWAMSAPAQLRPRLPNPREFAVRALGARASQQLKFAVGGAETKTDGIGLVLASPEFQRN